MQKLLAIVVLILTTNVAHAQLQGATKEEGYRLKVKQFDSFLRRFNFEEDPLGERIRDTAHVYLRRPDGDLKLNRSMMLLSLFHEDLTTSKEQLCVEFLSEVIGLPMHLRFYEPNWYAVLPTMVKHRGKEQKATFTFQIEPYGNDGSKWVICGLDAPFLAPLSTPDRNRQLHPATNESRFLTMNAALLDGEHFAEYLPKNFTPDALTMLYAEVAKGGTLSYGHGLEEPIYHLLQLSGWAVIVKFFIREERNTGWLIADIMRLTDAEKVLYRKEVLNITTVAE